MHVYIGLVHQEGDSAYGIQFPDVPGCFSASDDLDTLVVKASEALALHLEDEDLPHARELAEVRKDPEVLAELAKGAFLILTPLVRLTGRSQRANITIDAGLLSAIDKTATDRGLTRSAYLADLARTDITYG
ncbi:type II toxin-antitoxin system HicB family antitoxin [Roseibium algae]|uniref:Type II toxin-antitoxin system HicB family antitoxin n=1 Tax=Roseibium algae TaxID=3123038 RepID=A0ABU8TKJ0_9HYPH